MNDTRLSLTAQKHNLHQTIRPRSSIHSFIVCLTCVCVFVYAPNRNCISTATMHRTYSFSAKVIIKQYVRVCAIDGYGKHICV